MTRWPQRCKFGQVILCAGIECLRDDDRADNQGEQGAISSAAPAPVPDTQNFLLRRPKLVGREDVGVDEPCAQLIAGLRRIHPGARWTMKYDALLGGVPVRVRARSGARRHKASS